MIYFIYVNKFYAEKLHDALAPQSLWDDIFLYNNLNAVYLNSVCPP